MMRDPEKTIGNLIDKQSIAMLGSVDENGFPNIKAMLPPRKREGIRVFYFTTNLSSRRVRQFEQNPKTCLYFCDKRFYRGVQLTGAAEVLTSDEARRMIWQEGDTKYYAGGVTDPDYCVLRVTVTEGRYYSNFHSEDFLIG